MVSTAGLLALVFISSGSAARFYPPCNQLMFLSNVDVCLSRFNYSMETSGHQDRCPWPAVKRTYNELKLCVDHLATNTWCTGHGFLLDEIFLEVHRTYFLHCGQIKDPPLTIVIMFIAPVITVVFYLPLLYAKLATWKPDMLTKLGL